MAEILLDSDAFRHNLKLITQTIKQKPALVLKDNAYGHGLHEIANMAQEYGIKDVFVKNYAEIVAERNEMDYVKDGIDGSTMANITVTTERKSKQR